jgi:tetratricopeptide (TPR) repeat protein
MSRTSTYALAVFAIIAAPLCAQTQAPASPAPCSQTSGAAAQSKSQASKPCTPAPDKKEPSASQRFPFPGEQSAPSQQSKPDSPDAPASTGKPPSAADKFPFPTAPAPPMPGSEPDGSSSSSSDSADTPSPDNPAGDTGDTPHPSTRRRLPKVENLQTNEERVDEDLKVAKFYSDAGDLNAAYLRVRDAVKYLPNDPDTHFALAYVAQKMKKREEAIAEYNNYLRLAPDGDRTKDAHKALNELQR